MGKVVMHKSTCCGWSEVDAELLARERLRQADVEFSRIFASGRYPTNAEIRAMGCTPEPRRFPC